MRAENRKRYICCLLATIMLFLGMCLDIVETDSFFLYDSTVSTDAQIRSARVISDDDTSCTNEMLGSSKTTRFRNRYQANSGREQYRNILLSFIVGAILQYLFLLSEAEHYDFSKAIHSDAVTIAYIHRKDGEK